LIWSGVYKNFNEVLSAGTRSPYINQVWIKKSIDRYKKSSASNISRLDFSELSTCDLSFLLEFIDQNLPKASKILDFGGNLGQTGIVIRKFLNNFLIDWKVIEHKEFLIECEKIVDLPSDIEFSYNIQQVKDCEVELAYFGSSIQYIENWKKLLTDIIKNNKPKYIIFADAPISNSIPDFCSAQK